MAGLLGPCFSQAARPTRSEADATHIVIGEVGDVYSNESDEYVGYVVRLRIESIEKGEGLKEKEFLYAFCYQRKLAMKPGLREPGSRGHSAVPKPGQRIRAVLDRDKGIWEGIYPSWFKVLSEAESDA